MGRCRCAPERHPSTCSQVGRAATSDEWRYPPRWWSWRLMGRSQRWVSPAQGRDQCWQHQLSDPSRCHQSGRPQLMQLRWWLMGRWRGWRLSVRARSSPLETYKNKIPTVDGQNCRRYSTPLAIFGPTRGVDMASMISRSLTI